MRAIGKAPVAAVAIFVVMLSLGGWSSARAVDFTADVYEIRKDTTVVDKIYVKDPMYRLIQKQGRSTVTVLVDQDNGVATICMDGRKEYNYFPANAGMMLMNNPFQAAEHMKQLFERKPLGKDSVNGYECDKYVYMADTTELMVEWFSPKLNFPIRMQSLLYGYNEKTTELRYILEGNLDPSLFEIPDGYMRAFGQPLRLPDWESRLDEAQEVEVPYYDSLKAGDLIKIKVKPGRAILVKAAVEEGVHPDASAVPFKDGKPVGWVDSFRLYRLGGMNWTPLAQTSEEADVIVIGANKADVLVEARPYEQYEKLVKPGEEFRVPLVEPTEKSEFRAVNMSDSESTFSWTFVKNGQPLSDEKSEAAKYRHWTLRRSHEVNSRPFQPYGDEMVFKVDKGQVLIKVGQYDESRL